MREEFIDQWVNGRLWSIEARRHIRPDRSIRSRIGEFRSTLLVRKYQESFLFNKIMIGENDVLEYYKNHKEEFTTRKPAAYIEVYSADSRQLAEDIRNLLKKNERPASSAYVKLVYPGDCIGPLDQGIFQLKSPGVVGPVLHEKVYYVAWIIDFYPNNSLLRVEHVRDDIIQKLHMSERTKALQEKQKELKDRINVKIF